MACSKPCFRGMSPGRRSTAIGLAVTAGIEARRELLIVTPTFHPEKVGTPHYVTDLVRELQRRGQRPYVVTGQPNYPEFKRHPHYGLNTRRDSFQGVPVFRLPTLVPRGGRIAWRLASELNFLVQVGLASALRRIPRSDRVLVVHPGTPIASLAGRLLRRSGGRLVVYVHDLAYGLAGATAGSTGRRLSRAVRWLEVTALNLADVVVVLTEWMRRSTRDAGVRSPIERVGLWPTVEVRRYRPKDGRPTVLYSGSMGRKQGVERLLNLAQEMRQIPNALLIVRGRGSQRASLVKAARERGLTNVRFEEFVPEEELATALADAHVHVVPQLSEGAEFAVPSKIFNILAVGRPVVATAEEGSPLWSFSSEVPAVICAADDAELSAAVLKLLNDAVERNRLGDVGRHWIEQGNTREAAADRLLRLLKHDQ